MLQALRRHWREYLIEAWGLGIFLVAAGLVSIALEYPGSWLHQALPQAGMRRLIIGTLMGLTAVAIIYSPWGKRSGAHINPAVTLTFYRMGKLDGWDTLFYILAQFLGGTLGIVLVGILFGHIFKDPPLLYIVTVPGTAGVWVAFGVEFLMSLGLMAAILNVSNHPHPRVNQLTGWCAGSLVAVYITFLAPLSGMSINPARSFASSLPAGVWTGWWLYILGPIAAMVLAAELYLRLSKRDPVTLCGKLCPNAETPCLCQTCCVPGCNPLAFLTDPATPSQPS